MGPPCGPPSPGLLGPRPGGAPVVRRGRFRCRRHDRRVADRASATSADPSTVAAPARPAGPDRRAGRGLAGLRDDDGGLARAARPGYRQGVPVGEEHGALRPQRPDDGDPGRLLPAHRHVEADLVGDDRRRGRDGGRALLVQQRRRLPRHRPRGRPGRDRATRRAGRIHDHAAADQDVARGTERPIGLPEAPRGRAGVPHDAAVEQVQDPHELPQPGLLRQRRPRRRIRRQDVLRPAAQPRGLRHAAAPVRARPVPGRGGAADRGHRLADHVRPGHRARGGAAPARPGAAEDARAAADRPGDLRGGASRAASVPRRGRAADARHEEPVLRVVGRRPADRSLRRPAHLRGWSAGHHHDRPGDAGRGRADDQVVPAGPRRAACVAGRDR